MRETKFAAFIGIDWADRKHDVSIYDVAKATTRQDTVVQTPEAMQRWLAELIQRYPGQPIAVALEQTRGALFSALMMHQTLVLFPVNPAALSSFRDALYPSHAKDDPVDADLLMRLIRDHGDRLRPWKPDSVATRTLRRLGEDRRRLVDARTAVINQLTASLKESFPQALRWAGGLQSEQACAFLESWPTFSEVQKASKSQLIKFYRQHRHSLRWAEERVAQVRAAVPATHDDALIEVGSFVVQSAVGQLRALHRSIASYDARIAELFAAHVDAPIFASLPHAGAALAPRLLAAFGDDRERFGCAQDVAEITGIAPVQRRSGKTKTVHMRVACPKFIRQTFHEYARLSVGASSWAKAFYDQQRTRKKGKHAILRELAYRWIRILFRCWKDSVPYDETIYLEQLIRRGSPYAQQTA
jgi:transposase